MIYADNAATTRISEVSREAMTNCMENIWGNPSSLYGAGQKAAQELCKARERIAACIGAFPDEIYFTSGGSESDNQAIISAAHTGERTGKKHIISTAFEHHAVLGTLDKLKKYGFEITLLDVHENGMVYPEQLRQAIRADTCLVSIMYANNEIGSVMPIAELGRVCADKKVLFHTDAVQAAGHIKLDVKADNVDMLSLSAHKFRGPRGAGVLYARRGVQLTSLIEGGAQERKKRAGTENLPAIAGMAAALCEACGNMEENMKKLVLLREQLIKGLSEIPHSVLNGDRKNRLPGNVNFCFEGIEGEGLILLLDDKGICVSSGSACTSGSLEPSHVLLAIGRDHETAHGSLRITLSAENTSEEVSDIITAVKETVGRLRDMSPLWRDKVTGRRRFII